MKVWDLPVRLFHWAIVVLILAAWVSQYLNRMDLHMWIGEWILTLLLFRIVWGFIGSDTARFARFLRSPMAALRHLAHLRRREPDTEIGHNAAGGWMVLVMLALLAVQVGTGLCSNDDALAEGPLFRYVGKDRSDWLSRIHGLNFTLIEIVIVAHIVAILTYAVLKRHDLVRPMITGRKYLPEWMTPPRLVSPLRALVLFVIAIVAVSVFVNVL
jgi:cytochrome b